MTQKWLKMGVELEGSWTEPYKTVAAKVPGAQGKTDTSVHGMTGHMGEITTPPLPDLDEVLKAVKTLHPNQTNYSAGLHIHASFSDLDLSMLTTDDFWKYFRKRWEEWGEKWQDKMSRDERAQFWDRYHSRSESARRYCKDRFIPGQQLSAFSHDDRYTQLNFVSYKKFKTLECRLLPAFQNPEITLEAIKELADIYDTFLNTYTFPGLQVRTEIREQDDLLVDEEALETPDTAYTEEHYESFCGSVEAGEDIFYHIEGAQDAMQPWVHDAGIHM